VTVPIRVERNVLIPMSDGVSLAGDLFLPEAPGRYPVLVSFYPYHKDDVIGALFDHPNRYFAARGYASLLVDLRGLGNSGGVVWDTRDHHEATDGAQIVEWAAVQDWCDGSVGMWGMSYGGVTALQTAALRPPHLKAIVSMNGSTDPYHESRLPGGCLSCLGVFGNWGPWMIAMSVLPPMYQDAEGRWYRLWRERLATLQPPYIAPIQGHPTFDDYWRAKVIAVDQIEVPTYVMTAWLDQNPGAMTSAYERVGGPRKLLVGPWMHWMPDLAVFDRLDYLAEMTRWWGRWLRDEPTNIDREPPVTIFVQGAGWRHQTAWPVPGSTARTLFLDTGGALAESEPDRDGSTTYRADPTVGVAAGLWDPAGTGLGLPRDQSADDLRSVTFTSPPLPADLEITGTPEVTIEIALDEGPDANLVVKLCDVGPTGASALITSGWSKASQRASDEHPEVPPQGLLTPYTIRLTPTSYWIPAGHRVRLAVSCADFPRIWPTGTNPLIRLAFGAGHRSVLVLPIVTGSGVPGPDLPRPDPTVVRTPLDIEGTARYRVEQDFASDNLVVTTGLSAALNTPDHDGRFAMDRTARASVGVARPDTARVEGEAILSAQTPTGSTVVAEGRSWVSLFGQRYSARVTVDGELMYEKHWGD
jgi:putative CocE/NonD family hydrolase